MRIIHRAVPPPFPRSSMADNLHYSPQNQYMTGSNYYPTPHVPGHMHVVPTPPRQEAPTQRKRPKYTRSKTGCLTCRAKKIKCDETKPNCMRCTHGQRECTWPEGVPARKKPVARRDQPLEDTRPSTAGSSGLSDVSTPPTRNHTPPKREPVEVGLPTTMPSRRHSEPGIHLPAGETSLIRRATTSGGYTVPSNTQALPAIPEMSYSSHAQYQPTYPPSHPYVQQQQQQQQQQHQHQHHQQQSLAIARGVPQHDSTSSIMRSADHSHSGHWTSSPQMLTHVDPIEPFFQTAQERNLIRHYCDHALSIIMAFPIENPVLATNLQLILGHAPGSDSAVESLRTALLGIAAVHQSFLITRASGDASNIMKLAVNLRLDSRRLLAKACSTSQGAHSDAALGATVAIALIDIFLGGRDWIKNMNLAKTLVNMRGGPALLLARTSTSKTGSMAGVSRARLLLEILAVYELFGCLASGHVPTLLAPNRSSWWQEPANTDDQESHVEKVFGISRELVPILAQITTFLACALNIHSRITEVSDDATATSESDIITKAHELYNMLEHWTAPREGAPDRVKVGNRIYQEAAQITLLRDVLHLPPDDVVVQQHASSVLALCLECGQSKMGVDLNWPVIIAGSQMFGGDRPCVLEIFEIFRTQCCYEIETSQDIVVEVWKRLDDQLSRADWRSVVQDHNLNVLIL